MFQMQQNMVYYLWKVRYFVGCTNVVLDRLGQHSRQNIGYVQFMRYERFQIALQYLSS
jgi:hypothetical protein